MASLPDLYHASIEELQSGLQSGLFNSFDLVQAYLARIDEVNHKGPALHAVICTNPGALDVAQTADEQRASGRPLGPLHGIPIMVKDNIATQSEDNMPTTAGSYILRDLKVPGDAPAVRLLKEAGAIILGKANLSVFSNYRGGSGKLPAGWSPVGGQNLNPFASGIKGEPSGSSSGSATSATIGLAAAALGTQTFGSIVLPASWQNVVGMKPTNASISREGVVPISKTYDAIGPMCRCVQDANTVLQALKVVPSEWRPSRKSLEGVRLGVSRNLTDNYVRFPLSDTKVLFEKAINDLKHIGAEIVEISDMPMASFNEKCAMAIQTSGDFITGIEEYLSTLDGPEDRPRTFRQLYDCVKKNPQDCPPHHESTFVWDQLLQDWGDRNPKDNEICQQIGKLMAQQARDSIDQTLEQHNVVALLHPTESMMADLAEYPAISVPCGFTVTEGQERSLLPADSPVQTFYNYPGNPAGLTLFSSKNKEQTLLECAYAYEQHTRHRWSRRAAHYPRTQLRGSKDSD